MSYAIGHIVYGVDLTQDSWRSTEDTLKGLRDEIVDLDEDQRHLTSSYSGSGEPPIWFGIADTTIDECNAVDGQWLIERLTPSEDIKARYAEKLAALLADEEVSSELRAHMAAQTPRSQILWGSS